MTWHFRNYVGRLLPGALMALAVGCLLKLGAVQPLENLAYTGLFKLRGEIPWDDRIVLIKIDDASIQRLGRFPWSRQYQTRLLKMLTPADPSVILIDLIWSESTPDDAQLADAIADQGRVVLAQAQDLTGMPLLPVPVLRAAAIATGHIIEPSESDGITRKVPLQAKGEPALGLAALQVYGLVQSPISLPDLDRAFWVNWTGPVARLPQYSFADVISGQVPASTFQNKIVLVGVTAVGFDPLVSPFSQDGTGSGIHLHATIINSLLQRNALYPLNASWTLMILVAGGPLLGLFLSFLREEGQIVLWGIACVGWGCLALGLLKWHYWLLPVGFPLALFTGTAAAVAVGERLRMNRLLQDQLQQLWDQYEADLVYPTAITQTQISAALLAKAGSPESKASMHPLPPAQMNAGAMRSMAQLAALADQFGRSQSTQAAIARSLSIGLLAAERHGRVWFCNPVMQSWLPVPVGDQLENWLIPTWFTAQQWQQAQHRLQTKQPLDLMEFQRGDRWLELKLEPLNYRPIPQDQHAPIDGLLILLEDITLRKQVESSLAQQVKELEHLGQMKDEFLSTVSHELRAPMTNIRLVLELLPSAEDEAEVLQYLEILERECTRETSLINDLLDFQRLETSVQSLDFLPIDLTELLPILIQPYRERAAAQQQTLTLHMTSPGAPFLCDRASLERILTELLHNACKYTPLGGTITLFVHPNATHMLFVVQNSDAEIPAAQLPKIFDKFYRVPKTDRRQQGGTGLGLALVKKLVEKLNGSIRVQSNATLTTFTVQIPWVGVSLEPALKIESEA
jgi:signal transduction histidine kinase/CHASE2 domain-containing sensor protein